MKFRAVSGIMLTLIFMGMLIFTLASNVQLAKTDPSTPPFDYNDALIPPDVPLNSSGSSPPGYWETSEYLIGDVAVGVIFLESNGSIDPSTEDWTNITESRVVDEIQSGLTWLANYYPDANVRFLFDIHYRIPTSYEPINRPSWFEGQWIAEAMSYLGYDGAFYFTQIRDYINDLRDSLDTDWAFAMFIVDSYWDYDGSFPDGWAAYAYLGGPFLVMTYDNGGSGIGNMDVIAAHESCHIFYALDEYDVITEYSGYLNVIDDVGTRDLMDWNEWWLCTNSREQLGWRDTDGDGIQDIVDTFPDTTLNPYSPDPTTTGKSLTYNGSVVEVPYPNMNPFGTGRDVTINTITNVEFRVDEGTWMSATPTDGAFDEDEENFTFITPPLLAGTHTIETRGINSVGNIEWTYSSDVVTKGTLVGGEAVPIIVSANKHKPLTPTIELAILLAGVSVAVIHAKKRRQ